MNIWIFNHYAQKPDFPGGTRHYDMAKELIKRGHTVTIFAAGFHYTLLADNVDYNSAGYCSEDVDDINFIWMKTCPYKKNNIRRMLNIMSYYWRVSFVLPKLNIARADVIIGSTVHPFASLVASKFAKKYQVPFIYEIRDLWPQTFIDMNVWKSKSIKSFIFKTIEKISVQRAARIVILSPLTQKYLVDSYQYDIKNILLLPNGVNEHFIQKVVQHNHAQVHIAYIGGIDSVHGLSFLIDLAEKLKNEDILFDIYGDGKEKRKLYQQSLKKNLTNIIWYEPVPKKEVPKKLFEANLLLLSTANVLYGSENKLYEYMGSGKPIIVATAGGHNNPLEEIECGLFIDKSNIEESAIKIKEFIKIQSNQFESLGSNGQKYVLKYRTIKVLVDKLENLLNGLVCKQK